MPKRGAKTSRRRKQRRRSWPPNQLRSPDSDPRPTIPPLTDYAPLSASELRALNTPVPPARTDRLPNETEGPDG